MELGEIMNIILNTSLAKPGTIPYILYLNYCTGESQAIMDLYFEKKYK